MTRFTPFPDPEQGGAQLRGAKACVVAVVQRKSVRRVILFIRRRRYRHAPLPFVCSAV